MTGCNFRTKDEKYVKQFEGIPHELGYFDSNETSIRFLVTGDQEILNPDIFLFLHGSPGSMEQFAMYHKDTALLEYGLVVSVDRPGYGYSELGRSVPDFHEQAEMLSPLMHRLKKMGRITLIGHSFGGPIAVQLGALFKNHIHHIVLIAPAISPEDEKFVKLARFWKKSPFWWISSKSTKVATEEKLQHQKELTNLSTAWQELTSRVTYMHGTSDKIVPYQNYYYAEKVVPKGLLTRISYEGKGHFIPFSKKKDIIHVLTQNCQ